MDWDDLRFFLEIARGGSVSGAARALGVNHSTVSRRIGALEERLGVRLFDRLPRGWVTTAAGDDMFRSVLEVDEKLQSLERRLLGRDARLSGGIRVAIPDVLVPLVAPVFAEFAELYPGIELEVVSGNEYLNLSRREADVAIRGGGERLGHLVGPRVAEVGVSIYASEGYLAAHPEREKLSDHVWLDWDEDWGRQLGHEPLLWVTRWMRQNVPEARVVCRVNSAAVMVEMVRTGMGVAMLPCFAGDPQPSLRRVVPDAFQPGLALFVLTHEDLESTARVRCLLDFLEEAFSRQRDLLSGRSGA